MLEYIILGFLMKCDMSGYDIKRMIDISVSNFFEGSFGSIYTVLKGLEKKGYISSREEVEKGKFKKIYTISETGREEFLKWLLVPIDPSVKKFNQLAKVFFFGYLEKSQVVALLSRYIEDLKGMKKGLEGVEAVVKDVADKYQLSTLYIGKDCYQFLIDWYGRFLEKIISEE